MSNGILQSRTKEFRDKLAKLSREDLLQIIEAQDPELIEQIDKIEYVFKHKLTHLKWNDGTPIEGRPLTSEELILLIDEPFEASDELSKLGLSLKDQYKIHVANDSVLWAKHLLNADPRVYQILVLRHPSLFKVMRFGRRLGKRLEINTPIMTINGWSTMGQLNIGDKVFDEKGNQCNITYISPIEIAPKSYRVKFSDGSFLDADADHQWVVDTKASRKALGRSSSPRNKPIQVTTQQMLDMGLKTPVYTKANGETKYETSFSIKVAEPINHSAKDLPINPYVLGLWLGDGTRTRGDITTADHEILINIKEAGYDITKWQYKYAYNIVGLCSQLRQNNLLNNKHIPELYEMGSIEQRTELLMGIMDSDGYVDPKTKCCEISQKNESLALQIKSLIESLGYRAQIRKEQAKLYDKVCGFRYRISFTPWRPVFKLQRKLENQAIKSEPSGWQKHRYIIDIVPIDPIEMRCISVDSPSHLYLAGKEYIPTHNTFSLAVLLLHYAYTTKNGKCLVLTPMKSQAGLIYDEMMKLARESDIVEQSIIRNVTSPQYEIGFSNGASVRFFTSGESSGGKANVTRGQEAHLIVLDEMDYMADDSLDALIAMMQKTSENQPDKQMVGASTPTGRRGRFWSWCTGVDNRWKEFYFPSLANPFWDDQMEEFMREEHTTEMSYRHEVEADWGEDVDGVYPRSYIDIAFKHPGWDYKPYRDDSGSIYVMGVDWNSISAGTSFVVLEAYGKNYPDEQFRGKIKVAHREEMDRGEYTLLRSVDKVIELNAQFLPEHIYIDRGYGQTQTELIHKYGVQNPTSGLHYKVKDIGFGTSIEVRDPFTMQKKKKEAKPFMVNNLVGMLEKEQIVFPGHDEDLYLQLISYIVRSSSLDRPTYSMSSDSIPDHAHDALILACLAITENYDDLMKTNYATQSRTVSNETFLNMFTLSNNPGTKEQELEIIEKTWGSTSAAPVQIKRAMTSGVRKSSRAIRRKMF